ncbi:hypothetical protein BOX15_Mlig031635g2, partial [Macrostomum lignano]
SSPKSTLTTLAFRLLSVASSRVSLLKVVMTKRKAAATAAAAGLSQPTRAKSARTAAANKASTSSKLPPNFEWTQAGGLAKPGVPHMFVMSSSTAAAAKKCAVFDIDWCLIKPKSGGKWPKNATDWCWLFDSVPDKLRQLHSDGYRLLFISNQSGFEKGTTSPKEIMQKCELVISELGVAADVILIGSVSHFRKPDIGAWEFFVRDCNGGVEFDQSSSFFVGDAAGRPASGSRKKDFSCSDRMFAANIGLPFSTPEEFFLDEPKSEFDWGAPSPQSLLDAAASCSLPGNLLSSNQPELLLTVGAPACGKSSLAERVFVGEQGYSRANRDLLKTPAACLRLAEEAIKSGKSVIVDNTNPSRQDRAQYLELAKRLKVPARCLVMTTDKALAEHLNMFRQSQTASKVRRVPLVAYRMYYSKYSEPTVAEGFSEIVRVPFVYKPELLSQRDRKLILNWTTAGH